MCYVWVDDFDIDLTPNVNGSEVLAFRGQHRDSLCGITLFFNADFVRNECETKYRVGGRPKCEGLKRRHGTGDYEMSRCCCR